MDSYTVKLTSRDRHKLAKYLKYSKRESKLERIIGSSHPCEKLNSEVNRTYDTLSKKDSKPIACTECTLGDIISLYRCVVEKSIPIHQYDNDIIMDYCTNMQSILQKESQNNENTVNKREVDWEI